MSAHATAGDGHVTTGTTTCPTCHTTAQGSFCSACGSALTPTAAAPSLTDQNYTHDGTCRGCGWSVDLGMRAAHLRYCSKRLMSATDGEPAASPSGTSGSMVPVPVATPAPGWYPDAQAPGLRYWDGSAWGVTAPAAAAASYGAPVVGEKSNGLAVLFTILLPGAGHMYLGLSRKGAPYVVANVIGFCCSLTWILFPIAALIWIVTLSMTAGGISLATERVNAALREGRRIVE